MGQKLAQNGLTNAKTLISEMKKNIETEPLAKIDYVEAEAVVHPSDRNKPYQV